MRSEQVGNEMETIELTLPVNAAYVSAARLTASSISNRMGYNIEEIEDIKAAVSEACIYLIKQCARAGQHNFKIEFNVENNILVIELKTLNQSCQQQEECDGNELGIRMIQALMDELEIDEQSGGTTIIMKKLKK